MTLLEKINKISKTLQIPKTTYIAKEFKEAIKRSLETNNHIDILAKKNKHEAMYITSRST